MLAVSPSVGFKLASFNTWKLVENETFSSETTIVPDHPSISGEGEGGRTLEGQLLIQRKMVGLAPQSSQEILSTNWLQPLKSVTKEICDLKRPCNSEEDVWLGKDDRFALGSFQKNVHHSVSLIKYVAPPFPLSVSDVLFMFHKLAHFGLFHRISVLSWTVSCWIGWLQYLDRGCYRIAEMSLNQDGHESSGSENDFVFPAILLSYVK